MEEIKPSAKGIICNQWGLNSSTEYLNSSAQLILCTKLNFGKYIRIIKGNKRCWNRNVKNKELLHYLIKLKIITLILPIFLSWMCRLLFIIMGANIVGPGRTAPKRTVWSGPLLSQYKIPKYKGRFFFLFFIFPFLGQKSTGINNDVLSFYHFNFLEY